MALELKYKKDDLLVYDNKIDTMIIYKIVDQKYLSYTEQNMYFFNRIKIIRNNMKLNGKPFSLVCSAVDVSPNWRLLTNTEKILYAKT